ncbi:hypothetical protein VTK56DRAFT_9576 [Thermocarpiscus australiensis]
MHDGWLGTKWDLHFHSDIIWANAWPEAEGSEIGFIHFRYADPLHLHSFMFGFNNQCLFGMESRGQPLQQDLPST